MTDSQVSLHGDTDSEVHGAGLGDQANLEQDLYYTEHQSTLAGCHFVTRKTPL